MSAGTLLLACLLDFAIGDPRWFPHPVRLMGKAATWHEQFSRRVARSTTAKRVGGLILAIVLPAAAAVGAWALLLLAGTVHPLLETALAIVLAWTTLAARDLADHATAVKCALDAGAVDRARKAVGGIVGRDTASLSEPEIVRATTETIAESTSDGVVAPLLFLSLGGPPLALAFKAVSTLDSMIGHQTPRYRDLGWAAEKADDLANWVPARLTAWLIVLATGLLTRSVRRMRRAARIVRRDSRLHPSPNSGWPEAAMAGSLQIQLGGTNDYGGVPQHRPQLGDPLVPLDPAVITRALSVMWVTVCLAVCLAVGGLFVL